MTDSDAKREMLINKRVRALAVMFLTRRDDLTVEEGGEDTGLDLIVRFSPAHKEGVRQFGIATRGIWSAVPKDQADRLIGQLVLESRRHGPFAFPVGMFFFTMEGNDGWHAWVAEPIVRAGKAQLEMRAAADHKTLDKSTVDDIVSRVDRWYDAFYENVIVTSANGGKSGRRTAKR